MTLPLNRWRPGVQRPLDGGFDAVGRGRQRGIEAGFAIAEKARNHTGPSATGAEPGPRRLKGRISGTGQTGLI